ncbi:2-methylcitrate dehydratase, partial [Salmonella enterica subsp. enterica serovar Agona]
IEYPIGHKRRREEGIPVLMSKFKRNLSTRFSTDMVEKIIHAMSDTNTLSSMKVSDFMAMWMVN